MIGPIAVFCLIESPKSSVTAPLTKSQYWDSSGWSRPSWWLSVATACGVAWAPRMILAGSPGIEVDQQEATPA